MTKATRTSCAAASAGPTARQISARISRSMTRAYLTPEGIENGRFAIVIVAASELNDEAAAPVLRLRFRLRRDVSRLGRCGRRGRRGALLRRRHNRLLDAHRAAHALQLFQQLFARLRRADRHVAVAPEGGDRSPAARSPDA